MFRWVFLFVLVIFCTSVYAKEWANLKTYQKATKTKGLIASDWLQKDRTNNTQVWQSANSHNLKHNGYKEYVNIEQRRDFYEWFKGVIRKKGHEVYWVTMAHFISRKMRLFKAFPYTLFLNKNVKYYAELGNETVFNKAFLKLKELQESTLVLKGEAAVNWDHAILKAEQHNWIQEVYQVMDAKSLKTLKRIAKGKGLYSVVVPKSIRFTGELANPKDRFNYAIEVLKPYCKNRCKT